MSMDAEDRNKVREEIIKILGQSLEGMKKDYPDEIKKQLQTELFSEKFDELITVQTQGNNRVLGYFDVQINKFVSINMLSLVIILTDKLNQVFLQSDANSSLSVSISIGIFIASLLNIIQPADIVQLEREDAEVYCSFLKLQRDRPINMVITFEELERCMEQIGEEINLSECLTHLEEKRLIKVVPNGFIVKREVKVENVL